MTPQPTLTIRRATVDDAAVLAELGARTFEETFAADERNRPEDMAAYMSEAFAVGQVAAELEDARATWLVAEVGGVAAGYAKLYAGEAPEGVAGEGALELTRLYVAREWLGRGVGPALMDACLEDARACGHRSVWLGVWEHNARARAFYRKWGFRDVGSHVFQLGSDAQTDVLMEREL